MTLLVRSSLPAQTNELGWEAGNRGIWRREEFVARHWQEVNNGRGNCANSLHVVRKKVLFLEQKRGSGGR